MAPATALEMFDLWLGWTPVFGDHLHERDHAADDITGRFWRNCSPTAADCAC